MQIVLLQNRFRIDKLQEPRTEKIVNAMIFVAGFDLVFFFFHFLNYPCGCKLSCRNVFGQNEHMFTIHNSSINL